MLIKHLLGLAIAGALSGATAVTSALPLLTIVDAAGVAKVAPAGGATPTAAQCEAVHCEVTGDAGGTSYPYINQTPGGGPGVPSAAGGWPAAAGFAADPSFGGALGTSGWHAAYLQLTKPADVTFQFMGSGDSSLDNSFEVDLLLNNVWTTLFSSKGANAVAPCGAAGAVPVITCTPGVNEFSFFLTPDANGFVPFRFVTGNGVTVTNDGVGNPDPALGNSPGFFLGLDPYLAAGPFRNQGTAVYAGLTDLPGPGDHDFQDLGVRISVVPETGSLALLGVALAALAAAKKRKSRSAPERRA